MERTCERCGAANPERARFCMGCGVRLEDRCPRCGAALPAGARFCIACGAAVEAAARGRVSEVL